MTVGRCPNCQQPLDVKPRRKCYDCGKPMSNHDRWTLQPRGADDILTPVHRHCSHPRMMMLPSEYRAKFGYDVADRTGVPKDD